MRELRLLAEASPHDPDTLDAHPLVREHFSELLQRAYPEAWAAGHLRLYEYLTRMAKEFPDTLEEMTPLYSAVRHGCAAGKYQEVFVDVYERRIRRRGSSFNVKALGAFSIDLVALANFFSAPWREPVKDLDDSYKAVVVNNAGFRLLALGRTKEAIQPLEAGLEIAISQESWINASRAAINLIELFLTLGELIKASDYGKQSVELGNRESKYSIEIELQKLQAQAMLAGSLHQTGLWKEAKEEFRQAESRAKNLKYPLLYSVGGFLYCDLLLGQGKFDEVERRAYKMLKFASASKNLLDTALSHLLLGRASLLRSQKRNAAIPTQVESLLTRGIEGVRHAGRQDYFPSFLLARTAWARVTRQFDRATNDLAEARAIAERGEMRLHLADCHLESARLALATGDRDSARKAWEIARAMVEEMGYHRRDGEVAEIAGELG